MYFRSLFMSYVIKYGFHEENTERSQLDNFYCIQWLIWNEKLHLLDLLVKYENWGEYCLKNSEN